MLSNTHHLLPFDQAWQFDETSLTFSSSLPSASNELPSPETAGAVNETSKARFILNRLFQDYSGSFAIRLWNGSMLYIGNDTPAFTFCLEQASVLRDMVFFSDPARLAEAYFAGEVQILGDFNAAMQLRYYFESLSLPLHEKLGLVFKALTLAANQTDVAETDQHTVATNPLQKNESPAFTLDYDLPSAFYRLWLDERMLHSCAFFNNASQDLAQAQHNQLDLICLKLHLQHGDRLLDVSGSWGGLAYWAAKNYGAFVHTLVQNPEQYAHVSAEIKKQGLEKLVTVEQGRYDSLSDFACCDKAVNIDVCGQVGEQNLPAYLAKIHQVLKPGGLLLHHAITTESPGRQHELSTEFISRQIFADGPLTSLSHFREQMHAAKLEVFNVEALRRHQALTLRSWLAKMEQSHQEITQIVGERTYRIWRLYMTACAIQFEQGVTGTHQILAVRTT
jgi:cyclopropane-fatty-acyl-phospholipid synthase